MDICVDFDGTVVKHEYPNIGEPVPFALYVLKQLQEKGHRLILFTMRSGKELDAAVKYMKDNGIKLHGINVNPAQKAWTKSPKAYGELYIDDAALGCPLEYEDRHRRPYVDWAAVAQHLKRMNVI